MWKINRVRLHLGAEAPVRILHLTDPHLVCVGDEENASRRAFAAWRKPVFDLGDDTPVALLEAAMEYSRQFDCTVITGDVVDYFSDAGCAEMRRIFAGYDPMFCVGNHEYLQAERHETRTHEHLDGKKEVWDALQSVFGHDIGIDSRIVGGVNLITADNAQFAWTEEQYEFFRMQVAKGVPILLFTHVPMHMPSRDGMKDTSTCHGHMRKYGFTDEQIALSSEVTEFLVREPLVKAFFAGHCHLTLDCPYRGKPCYITGGLFTRDLTEILID